jgi:RNA polymerase sigma-54 factor
MSQKQIQTQKLMMTQTLRQSLEILNFSSQELENFLEQKQQENPLLTVRTRTPLIVSNKVTNQIPTRLSVYDVLNEQLVDFNISSDLTRVVKWLINDLDKDGFLTESYEDYARMMSTSASIVIKAIAVIQQCEPIGIGAKSTQETYLIQANHKNASQDMIQLITNHFELFITKKWKELAKRARISLNRVQEISDCMAFYTSSPLGDLLTEQSPYIRPDAHIDIKNGEVNITYYGYAFPRVGRDATYITAIPTELDAQTFNYLEKKKKEVDEILSQLLWRKETLQRIIEEVVRIQFLFFTKGPEYLIPLTMTDLAFKLGLHESTISRAVREKYLHTRTGVVSMKSFFSQASTEDVSAAHVKSRIRTFIAEENKAKPISDQVIVDRLQKEGIRLSRRVIAKYRDQLSILGSSKRKRFGEI